jgi:hypothetical protein
VILQKIPVKQIFKNVFHTILGGMVLVQCCKNKKKFLKQKGETFGEGEAGTEGGPLGEEGTEEKSLQESGPRVDSLIEKSI